jgi:hypothetical protein
MGKGGGGKNFILSPFINVKLKTNNNASNESNSKQNHVFSFSPVGPNGSTVSSAIDLMTSANVVRMLPSSNPYVPLLG